MTADQKTYLTTNEVTEQFGWSRDSLYRFYRKALINPKKFLGNKKTFWDIAELEGLKFRVIENENGSRAVGAVERRAQSNAHETPDTDLKTLEAWLNQSTTLPEDKKQAIWQIASSNETVTQPGPGSIEQQDFIDRLITDWKREIPQINEELFALFSRLQRAGRVFDRDVEHALAVHGLKIGEFVLLAALRRIGAPYCLTPTQLFKSLLITSGTITKRIDRLERRGLVRRQPDPDDRRGTLVALTAFGKETVDRAVAWPGEEPYKWLQKVLTPSERQLLESLLRKLLVEREKEA